MKYTEKDIKAIYALSYCTGYAILDILYGIEDYAVTCYLYNGIIAFPAKNKIYSSSKGYFVKKYGKRVYLDEFMRIKEGSVKK